MEMCTNEFFLPEDTIQLIQSYMTAKEAARTSIVSKSWRTAWLTRPDLDFDQHDFGWQRFGRYAEDIFWQFVEKTTQRYDELNLRIQSLRLRMLLGKANCSNAGKLIVRALKLRVTDISVEVDWFEMVFPQEVFRSETLRRLSVRVCKIGLGEDRKARCSRLESLSLKKVVYKDGDIIWDIISSCPLIENLSLSDCEFEHLLFDADTSTLIKEFLRSRPFNKLSGSAVDGLIISPFRKLKSLFLEKVSVGTSFFLDFGSKFPCLEDLSVHKCDGYHGLIQIASSSLQCISFAQKRMLRATFEVRCIRKFMYQGSSLPSLFFKDYSRGWKSDISVTVNRYNASWFLRLKKLIANLSQYETCLSLKILRLMDKSSGNGRDNGLAPVAVKDLMLYLEVPSSITSSFLKGLFWSCRPKFVTLHLFPGEKRGNHDFLVLFSKTITHLELSGVNVEVFDEEAPAGWRRSTLETLSEASRSPEYRGKIRFQLR